MIKLFGYLFKHWKAMLLVVLFLCVQAYCDLSLPSYTSNIVNIGIQQGGIDDKIPRKISTAEMQKLFLFVSEDDQKTVLEAYELDKTTYNQEAYVLKESVAGNDQEIDKINTVLAIPMMLTAGFESDSEMTQKIQTQLEDGMKSQGVQLPEGTTVFDILGMMSPEARNQVTESIKKEIKKLPAAIVDQAAIAYIKTAYKDLGIDINQIQTRYLMYAGVKMVALAFLSMIASLMVGFIGARVGATIGRDLRSQVFRKVVGFSNNEFNQFSTASLITRSTNDIQQIQLLLVMVIRMILYAPILAIGAIYKVFNTNVSMSWIIGLAVALIGVLVIILFTVAMPKFRSLQKLVDRLNLVTREILTGLQVIRAFHTEKHEEARFEAANQDLTSTNLFVNRAMTFMMPAMMLIMNGISVLIVWTGAHGINEGQMQVGDLMAFIQYTMQIIISFLMLCIISIMLPRAGVAAGRIDEVISSQTVIFDPKEPKHLEEAKGLIQFNHVSFRYPGASEDVLHDISFTARPGKTTAIIGSTGSGKSTLINLIPRFYDVTEGNITFDGIDIRDITQSELHDKLGYVPQKGVLFSGDIASNIMYGNENGSPEEMIEAAEIAQATEFIDAKPKKYESSISQGGSNVSGGQKQRLSIARAVAKRPPVFIFDDSFSALDFKTDVALRKALKAKTAMSTVLIVAQRISTILHAEQIIVLNDGEVAGIGTHQELVKSCEVYQQIAMSQLSEAELQQQMQGKEKNRHE